MSGLGVRRAFVWIVSMIIGFGAAFLIITLGFDMLPLFTSIQTPQAVTVAEYGTIYFLVTAIPLGLISVIWLDKFMGTKILPD
ncbi:hypothetical protein MASR2M15_12360 [Anaerolineales bacterium]